MHIGVKINSKQRFNNN